MTQPYTDTDSNQPYVGFDLDDVLVDLRSHLSKSMSDRMGRHIDWRHWQSYNFYEGMMSHQDFMQMIIDDRLLEQCRPEHGALEVLQELNKEGIKIAIITARGFHPEGFAVTMEMLQRSGMPFDRLHIVEHRKGKAEPALSIENLVAYADDHAAHLDAISSAFGRANRDLHLSLVTRPWNASADGYHRVEHLKQFMHEALKRCERLDSIGGPEHLSAIKTNMRR